MFLGSLPLSICNSDFLLLDHRGQSSPFYLPIPKGTDAVAVSGSCLAPTSLPWASLDVSSYVTCTCFPVGTSLEMVLLTQRISAQ